MSRDLFRLKIIIMPTVSVLFSEDFLALRMPFTLRLSAYTIVIAFICLVNGNIEFHSQDRFIFTTSKVISLEVKFINQINI